MEYKEESDRPKILLLLKLKKIRIYLKKSELGFHLSLSTFFQINEYLYLDPPFKYS